MTDLASLFAEAEREKEAQLRFLQRTAQAQALNQFGIETTADDWSVGSTEGRGHVMMRLAVTDTHVIGLALVGQLFFIVNRMFLWKKKKSGWRQSVDDGYEQVTVEDKFDLVNTLTRWGVKP